MAWILAIGSQGNALILTVTCDSEFAGQTITCTDGTTMLTKTCPSSSPYTVEFNIPNAGTWTISSGTDSTSVTIPSSAELHSIPTGSTVTPTDVIQTWLHCANIWDKSYTTISEVLNDATTVTTLIASNNAVDYMVRSTTWASTVNADSSAMTKIGANNYCSDKLLANSTWLDAIIDSTYFESVLNCKIPTMTSNTAPSGEAFASSEIDSSRKAYCAFNNVYSTGIGNTNLWHSAAGLPQFVGYKNTDRYCVKYAKLRTGSYHAGPKVSKLQGSNDSTDGTDGTWVDIGNFVNCPTLNTWYSKKYNSNTTKYSLHRLYITDSNLSGYGTVDELQLYGRKDV